MDTGIEVRGSLLTVTLKWAVSVRLKRISVTFRIRRWGVTVVEYAL